MNDLKIFQNEEFGQVRVVMQDGEPWFVANDVCRVLEIKNQHDAMKRLDVDEKSGVDITDPHGRTQRTNCVNESGLYTLILTSRKPEAHAFKRWVTHDILPSIARTGKYENPNSPQTNGTITIDEDSLVRIGSVFCTETVKALLPFIRPQTEPAPVVVTADLPKEPRKRRLVPLKDFSDVLKWVQRKEGLSGFQIAREINVSERTVSLWRNGIVRPNPENFQRFVIRFNIPVSELEEGVFD